MAIPRRGLQDIRTLTGRVRKATLPHEAYLRISHIELERARKTKESEKAGQLVADISHRLQEIEAEKDGLLQAMGEQGGPRSPAGPEPGPDSSIFKIKY